MKKQKSMKTWQLNMVISRQLRKLNNKSALRMMIMKNPAKMKKLTLTLMNTRDLLSYKMYYVLFKTNRQYQEADIAR